MKRGLAVLLCMAMLLTVVLPVSAAADTGITVTTLKQTSSTYDLGIAADNVRLAWELGGEARGVYQSAYRLTVRDAEQTVYDTDWVESTAQSGIKAENLEPETVYTWTVNVKDQYGNESGFAEEATFETAPAKVDGAWIGTANLLRKEFTLAQPVAEIDRARSYIGSSSPIEIHLNGGKVGDLVLSPKRPVADGENYYNTYDILPYLQDGGNALGVMLSNAYTMGNRACGMLKIWYKNGETQTVATGRDWKMTDESFITRYGWYNGEDVDVSLMRGWDEVGYDDASWKDAELVDDAVYDGLYHVGENAGMVYGKPTFSGDYTIEAGLIITDSIGSIMFGAANPNPAMWQFDAVNNTLRVHRPSGWGAGDIDIEPCSGIRANVLINVKIEIVGTTVKTYIEDELVNTSTVAEGVSTGRVGFRTAVNENFNVDYLRVVQNGSTIFEDNFDALDNETWSIATMGKLVPAISGTKIFDEVKPVDVYEATSDVDTTKPYCVNGHMVFPTNCGTFTTHQTFSGDYSIEVSAQTDNYFGLIFGNGSQYPLMAQMRYISGGQVLMHQQNNWSGAGVTCVDYPMNINTEYHVMRVDVVGEQVTLSVNGEEVLTTAVAAGSTSGPIGIRETLYENAKVDYVKVYQNGEVIFQDDFDTINTDAWTIPAQGGGSKLDKTRPYCENGTLYLPTNCGIHYSKQRFSGDYTIEMEARSNNVFGPLFGNGSPNPPMWQFSAAGMAAHMPGSWGDIRRSTVEGMNIAEMTKIKLEIKGNDVTATVNGVEHNTITLPEGATSGPLGFRETIAEDAALNYVRVTQNGEVIFEDDFDFIDTSKWDFRAQEDQDKGTRYVVDFGKNMSGYVRVNGQLAEGRTITLRYSEMVDEVGNIFANTTFHYPSCTYTFTGGQDSFEPYFFYTGFRYVEVECDFVPDASMFTACFISDDVAQTGQFETSNERLNRVFDLYYRSQRSNMVGNYTDCPQREKNGWCGDASVTKHAASILFGDYNTAEAYMRLMEQNIRPNGEPHCILPVLTTDTVTNFDIPWATAYFTFPYYTYQQTGDTYYIERMYDSLVKVFNYYLSIAAPDGVPQAVLYGDWLGYDNQEGKIDRSALGATCAYYSGSLLAEMAEAIGRDHTQLDADLAKMYDAMQVRYNKDAFWSSNTQTGNSMALDFDLVPAEQKAQIVEQLVQNVSDYGSLRTGVLGTLSLYNTLSEANRHKVLLDATITGKKCSFGYMLDNGATSMWEYWDRAGEGFNSTLGGYAVYDSQNHCMMGGGLTAWMFEGLGGIRSTAPAYHEITYRPGLESELIYVNSSVDTMIGRTVSDWTYENDVLDWTVTVPVNATAKIVIPVADATVIEESGVNVFKKDGNGLTYVGMEDGAYVYTAGSGTYAFHVTAEPLPEYAAAVDALIDAIGKVTVDSGAAIEAARAAYDALDDSSKALVTKLAVLEAAEHDYKVLTTVVALTVTGPETVSAFDEAAVFTVSAGDMVDLANVILTFELNDDYLTEPVAEGLNGWIVAAQSYSKGKLIVVALHPDGVSGEGDLLKLTAKPRQNAGTTTVALTEASLNAYLTDDEAYVDADLSGASADVEVGYNVYDVNHDGVVDQLDMTRAQRFYGHYVADCDVNADGEINVIDLILIWNNFTA